MPSKLLIPLGIALTVVLAGCMAYRAEPVGPEPRPLGKEIPAYRAPRDPTVHNATPTAEPAGDIALSEALALALTRNPEFAAFSREIRAREAAVLQAGLLPNPVLGAVAENFGNSSLQGFDGTALTAQLSQLIELGGKRAARITTASLTRDLAGWDYETKRIDVLTRVSQAFVEVLSAQQRVALTQQTVQLAEQVQVAVSARVKAGKVSPVEETKAHVALSSSRIELTRAQRELEVARKRLAATWGSTTPLFKRALGDLGTVLPIPSLEQLAQRLSQNPELARWAAEITQRQAVLALERTRAVPDITTSVGVRRFDETSDQALVAGVSLPLPVFNRNQGAILEAHQHLAKAEDERRDTEVRVITALAAAYQTLASAYTEVMALKADVLPGAQSAFDAVNQGYRLGKFGFLDVLDAQRTLFGSKAQNLRALSDYHKAVAEVERLIGERLEAVSAAPKREESR